MAQFDQAFRDEVRAKNDIVEVISAYVRLEQRGNRYVGLCPFHGEKTPSFHVVPEKQFYHCFGCKASGDVIKFIQEREHLTFPEAMTHLANRAKIPLPEAERTPDEERAYQERRLMYDAMDVAARFYHSQLFGDAGQSGLAYLRRRGLTDETIRQFRLGWAPGHGALYGALRGKFRPELLQKVGLIMTRRDGSGYMDSFFERVIFPITDTTGRVIGFGGRLLEGEGPKYKNTAETPLFFKRQVLYGLSHAKEAMRTRNQAILVEGYMDVIMPHQVGLKQVVAPLGTALTDEQCKEIRRQAEQVIVAFDADTAGQMATLRGLETLYDSGCDVRILRLPEGKDPDEYILKHGLAGFQQAVDEAVPLMEFKLDLALGKESSRSPERLQKAVEAVARVLVDLKADVAREEYLNRVAKRLAGSPGEISGMKAAIARQMNRLRQGFQHNQPSSRNNMRGLGPYTADDLLLKAERNLLYLLLQHPNLMKRIRAELGEAPFVDPAMQSLFAAALGAGLGPDISSGLVMARMLDSLADGDTRLLLTEMEAGTMLSVDPQQEAADCIEKIKQHRVSRRIDHLNEQIKATEAAGEPVDTAVLQELMQLQLSQRKRTSKS